MKSILLTSTALVAFAGAAFADGHAESGVTFSGDAEIGYNDTEVDGFYYGFGATITGTAALDNGLVASMSGDIEFNNADNRALTGTPAAMPSVGTFDQNEITIDDLTVSLYSDTASLTFGDTAPAADAMWSGVGNMENDDLNDEDNIDGELGILIGKVSFGGTDVGISYAVIDDAATTEGPQLSGLQLGVTGEMGNLSYGVAYQDDTWTCDDIFGLRVGTSFGGADVALGYADSGTNTSTGISVSYPVGDITVGAFYVIEDNTDDNYGFSVAYESGPLSADFLFHDGTDEDVQLNVAYDMGNGISVFGGYRAEGSGAADIAYLGADYDLGGGANFRASYVDVSGTAATAADQFGPGENLKEGMTIEVSFAF